MKIIKVDCLIPAAEMREAYQHAIKVMKEGSCQWPRARVIPVQDLYPSMSTMYIPHCAILHRCTDDTGCCRSEALTCVPKETQKVELYFYVSITLKIFFSTLNSKLPKSALRKSFKTNS